MQNENKTKFLLFFRSLSTSVAQTYSSNTHHFNVSVYLYNKSFFYVIFRCLWFKVQWLKSDCLAKGFASWSLLYTPFRSFTRVDILFSFPLFIAFVLTINMSSESLSFAHSLYNRYQPKQEPTVTDHDVCEEIKMIMRNGRLWKCSAAVHKPQPIKCQSNKVWFSDRFLI